MRIRRALREDSEDIHAVHTSAFPVEEASQVAGLAIDLLNQAGQPETLSLVAEVDGRVVGHIAFSPVSRADDPGWSGYILAPLAVKPAQQRSGVGAALVNAGLQRLSQQGVAAVFVYGDPAYYGRFGFDAGSAAHFLPRYTLQYPSGWQARLFDRGHVPAAPVEIRCVAPLNDPALW